MTSSKCPLVELKRYVVLEELFVFVMSSLCPSVCALTTDDNLISAYEKQQHNMSEGKNNY